MKTNRTLFSLAILALLSISSNVLNAQTAVKTNYISDIPTPATEMTFDMSLSKDSQDGKFILAVENPEALPVSITVESNAGLAYQSELSSMSFRKRFDLSTKKDGEYTVVINNGRRSYRKVVSIKTNGSTRMIDFK